MKMNLRLMAILCLLAIVSSCQRSGWNPPDPKLREQANKLDFSPDLAMAVDQAFQRDIARAVLDLQNIARKPKESPTEKQKQWLETQVATLTPAALAFLKQEFDDAASDRDLRGMTMASAVADRIKKDAFPTMDRLKEARNKILSGTSGRVYWEVRDASAEPITSYDEPSGSGYFRVSAKEGAHLVKVAATIKNVDSGRDAPYALAYFDGVKASMAELSSQNLYGKPADSHEGSFRWLDQSLIFLVTPSGDLIECGVPVQGSDFRGGTEIVSDRGVFTPPRRIRPSQEMKFIGIFAVSGENPDPQTLKLLVLGAAPVLLRAPAPAQH